MRSALQKLLGSPSTLSLLRDVLSSNSFCVCRHYSKKRFVEGWRNDKSVKRHEHEQSVELKQTANGSVHITSVTVTDKPDHYGPAQVQDDEEEGPVTSHKNAVELLESTTSKKSYAPRQPQESREEGLVLRKAWRSQLSTFQQYLDESSLDAPLPERPLLLNNELYAADWLLWLELVRFRRRHVGIQGTQVIFKEIFRRDKHLPIRGNVGKELWDLLLQAGHQDQEFMKAVVTYAVGLKKLTGNASPRMYGAVVGHALKVDPKSALGWHNLLKEDIAPSIEDYKKLFRLCVSWGSVDYLRELYENLPIFGMYATSISELCRLQMYDEAMKWHHVLCERQDFPLDFGDVKPLLAYVAQTGGSRQMEQLISCLDEAQPTIIDVTAKYVRKNEVISREIMYRQLGEVHGVTPKKFSDSFCARLFATRTFAVKTIISGLQMMAVESIGPMSLREIALRDDCFPEAILRHFDHLEGAGISPDNSIFSVLLQDLARTGSQRLLRALVECDAHPDTFEDLDLQERLLAQYYEADDRPQIERTLAVLMTRAPSQKDRARWWWNLVLRSHVTLKRRDAVRSIMDKMLQADIPISVRSSRHLRVTWLSKRQVARRAAQTQELSIIIRATQSTMNTGGFVPIISWREIMRRLGMAGRLVEFENLAFWLVDYYSSPTGQQNLLSRTRLQNNTYSPLSGSEYMQPGLKVNKLGIIHHPQQYLKILFTSDAQQAIVAWGFQQEVSLPPKSKHAVRELEFGSPDLTPTVRPPWTWGLVLLRKLQQRGVPIEQATVSKICKHRLNALFGHGSSNRPINRLAKSINDTRLSATGRSTIDSYIREMEEIWGDDLFQHQSLWVRRFLRRKTLRSGQWSEKGKHGRWHPVDTT